MPGLFFGSFLRVIRSMSSVWPLAEESAGGSREAYESEVRALEDLGNSARAARQSEEDTARMLYQVRRDLGRQYKSVTPPDELARITARNIEKYGDPLGPSVDYLRARGKSWQDIIDSAARPGGKDLGY